MKKTILLALLIITNIIFSQENITDSITTPIESVNIENKILNPYNPLFPPNTYAQSDNPNYWKNKLPHEGYWQQDVHYSIQAELFDSIDAIDAHQIITYTNNSPDELNEVFFHLYQNAFQPDSYLDKFKKSNKEQTLYRRDEIKKKGMEIRNLTVNQKQVEVEIDNTIMKVFLNEPIKSGETIVFDLIFRSHFGGEEDNGNVRRRMKMYTDFGNKHYNGVHWYPRISVYDRKFGWTTDQHL